MVGPELVAATKVPVPNAGQEIVTVPLLRLIESPAGMQGGVERENTVTVKLHVAALPCESTAVHWTVFVPSANTEPDGGTQETLIEPVAQALLAEGAE